MSHIREILLKAIQILKPVLQRKNTDIDLNVTVQKTFSVKLMTMTGLGQSDDL